MQKLKALEILKAKKQVLESNLKDRINNSYNIQYEDDSQITSAILEEVKFFDEAIEELEQYEQNFKQKEFDYRTKCQNVLSAGRVEADNMPDRLAELEKVILDYYLAKGYQIDVGNWNFRVEIISRWKSKYIAIRFYENNQETLKYIQTSNTTKEMFDEAIECFSTNQIKNLQRVQESQNKCDTCKYIFATCKGNNQVFGNDGIFNDAVLECESYLLDNEKKYLNEVAK